jgi:uncharacterized protein YjiS (DUF1127 family)
MRAELLALDDHVLRDVGISREALRAAIQTPFRLPG